MKILLLHPAYKEFKISEPLGLCYLASYLRGRQHQVHIFDPRIHGFNLEETLNYLKHSLSDYQLIGISSCDSYHESIKMTIQGFREYGFTGHITLGGYGPSTNWEKFLSFESDSLIIGEGERTLLELAERLNAGTEWRNLPGIAFKNGELKVCNPANPIMEDLDLLPFPARDIYLEFRIRCGSKFISPQIQGSRGCYGNCSFCSTPEYLRNQGGPKHRMRSIQNIVAEIEYLYHQFGATDYEFVDDNFFPPNISQAEARAQELLAALSAKNLKITFFMQFRPEVVTVKLLKTLKEAGMTRMFIGIESFNDQDLLLYNRLYTAKDVHHAVKTAFKSGFSSKLDAKYRFRFGFINFNPLSTLDGLAQSEKFFRKYNLSCKKLTKKLALYDDKRAIYQKIIAAYPNYSSEGPFK